MTGETLIRELVTSGRWTFLFEDTETFELGSPSVQGDSAKIPMSERVEQPRFRGRGAAVASLLFGKKKGITYQVYFVKGDDEVWRLDETSMVAMEDRMIDDYLSETRSNMEAVLKDAFESDDGKPSPPEMWNPPKHGAKAIRPERYAIGN